MKIRVKHAFKYTWDNSTTQTLEKGDYDVPRNVDQRTAELALSFGAAVIVPEPKPAPKPKAEKKAPENKQQQVDESK